MNTPRKNRLKQANADLASWSDKFKRQVVTVGFNLSLTRSQLEMLSAIAQGVCWDRARYSFLSVPDNWIQPTAALVRRGLIAEKTEQEKLAEKQQRDKDHMLGLLWSWSNYKLTPPGELMIELLKHAGLFEETEIAAERNAVYRQRKTKVS